MNRGVAEDTELPVAFVVVKPEDRTSVVEKEIHQYVNQAVARYKRLAGGIVWVDESEPN